VETENERAEKVTLTPVLAQKLLGNSAPNRTVSPHLVGAIARDIAAGQFTLNGETIKINADGQMFDGQHRCHAVVSAGIPVDVWIVYGASEEFVDVGRPRTYADILGMTGHASARTLASVTRAVNAWERGRRPGFARGTRPTVAELDATLIAHPDIYDVSARTVANVSRIDCPPSGIGLCWWLFMQLDETGADEFMSRVADGIGLDAGHPALVLRERLRKEHLASRHSIDVREGAALIITAWNGWRAGRSLTKLQMPFPLTNENYPRPRR
jgi:hypothetical protein